MTVDLLVWGPTFFDVGLTGLSSSPAPGTEVWAEQVTAGVGGVATTAIAAARLGLSTELVTWFGGDDLSMRARAQLEAEHVALEHSVVVPGQRMPLTVALGNPDDRTMVSHGRLGHEVPPLVSPPEARFAVVPIDPGESLHAANALARRTVLLACGMWDATGRWRLDEGGILPLLHTLVVNHDEARLLTGEGSPEAAARTLLARVPHVVVTHGAAGAVAADAGGITRVDGIPVTAIDSTGAGDVLLAGLVAGLAGGASFTDAVRTGVAAGSLAVTRPGSAAAAPTAAAVAALLAESNPAT